jgi:hypothetical protein
MATCSNCGNTTIKCGCKDTPLTTPPSYTCPPSDSCPDPTPCFETIQDTCVVHSLNYGLPCLGVEPGMTLEEIIQLLNIELNSINNTIPTITTYGLFAQTANSTPVTNTAVETTLINGGVGTLTIPANGFDVGHSFRAVMGGVMNAANNQTIRIKVKAGSIILLDSGIQSLTNSIISDIWSLNIDFTIRQLGAAGVASLVTLATFHYTKTNNATVEGFAFNNVNNTTFDTTISNTLNITVQWGAANPSNSIYSDIFVLNKVY